MEPCWDRYSIGTEVKVSGKFLSWVYICNFQAHSPGSCGCRSSPKTGVEHGMRGPENCSLGRRNGFVKLIKPQLAVSIVISEKLEQEVNSNGFYIN